MFYSQFILAKKGPLGTIWIAAHLERKLRKNQVADTDIGVSVDSILFPEVPIALRLSSHLLVGVVRIYSRKVNYLFHDCSEALLKIKQAFRSTNVDLPPEESTAPYHSITLPDTFHLDDFELPDSAFQGDYDHHVSSKEQITLQDNLDKTGFSTSKFGLDERFGDGNASHVGLDLDEELFMHKDETNEHVSIRFVTNEFEQGESSENRTNMEIDEPNTNQKESNWSGGGYNIPTPGYNILTPAYNIQTPDLNEIFFAHDNNDGNNMDGPSNPTTPYAVDPDPPSPGFIECAPPSTPGLMEETGLARVNDASPSINNDDNNINNNGKININNEVAFLVPCEEGVKEVEKEIENGSEMQIEENNSNLVNVNLEDKNIINNDNDNMQVENNNSGVVNFEDNNVNNMEVENISGALNFEDININNNNMEVENNSGAVNLEDINNNNNNNLEVENNSGAVNLEDNNNAMQIENDNNNNFDVVNSKDINECTTPLVLETISEIEQTPEQAVYSKDISTNNFTNEPSTNNQFTSEPEKMLHAPSINNEFGQITTEKTVLESDGSVDRTTSNLIGQKRHLEEERESLLNFEKGSTERVSSRQRVRKINSDFINPDDDFLASILGSSRTPGLRLGPTPNKASSSKRQKVGPMPKSAVKRKVQMDESMVLHADVIRQQLINTEDIKRLRKKAPCTRAEIWIIKKGPLEDEIFNESLFSGCIEELTDLQHQVYEIDISKPLKQLIRENKGKGSFHEIQTLDLQNPKEIQTLDLQNPIEIQTLDSQNPIEIQTLDTENPKPNEDETLEIDSPKPIENENLDVENQNLTETETLEIQNQSIEIQNQTLEIENPNEVETLDVQTPMAFTSEAQVDSNPNNLLLSEFNEENCLTDQQQFENNNTEENLVDLSKNEENLLEGSGLVNLDETKDELDNNDNNIRNSEIDNLFEDPKEDQNPNLENLNEIQEGFSFGIEGENSGFVGVESFGNDFVPKENSDFCSAIEGVDTDFLNVDDEVDFHEEANDDEANPGDLQSLDNSGWSSRTRGVGRYLKLLFDEETGHGRKSVAIDQLLGGKTRKEASRMFFETLVLTTKDYIHVKQESPFGLVNVRPGLKLMQSEF